MPAFQVTLRYELSGVLTNLHINSSVQNYKAKSELYASLKPLLT